MKWAAQIDGEQVFTIWPQYDIDFVLYELSEEYCPQKTAIRCMASGDFTFPSMTAGKTYLLVH